MSAARSARAAMLIGLMAGGALLANGAITLARRAEYGGAMLAALCALAIGGAAMTIIAQAMIERAASESAFRVSAAAAPPYPDAKNWNEKIINLTAATITTQRRLPTADEMLDAAQGHTMTDAELEAQRRFLAPGLTKRRHDP